MLYIISSEIIYLIIGSLYILATFIHFPHTPPLATTNKFCFYKFVFFNFFIYIRLGPLGGFRGKEPACQCKRCKGCGSNLWVRKIPQRRKWQPTPVFLHGKSHGQRSLAGYSPWGCKKSDMTEVA